MTVPAYRPHPGKVLKDHYLDPLDMSAAALAGRLEMSSATLVHLVRGNEPMTADTALRLARCFGTTPEFWMDLQRDHDLTQARQRANLNRIEPVMMPVE
jgi:addiction module HigA family antidote